MSDHFKTSPRVSLSGRVALCAERAVTINGQTFVPDAYSAYVEFYLGHAFPVVTSDRTALHPQVVANSFQGLFHKVFDLGHLMMDYNPELTADRVMGTIVGVEFPPTPAGGWTVQADKAAAPGIRAVAVLHRQARGVDDVLRSHFSGRVRWTVSMEQEFAVDEATLSLPITSGFCVQREGGASALSSFAASTPPDLAALGWTYVPCLDAPAELQQCFRPDTTKCDPYQGCPTVLLFGGLDGRVQFKGTGLTPLGKEAEARVAQMLASGTPVDVETLDLNLFCAPLLAGLAWVKGSNSAPQT